MIDFVTAGNGDLQFYSGDTYIGWATTAKGIATILQEHGMADNIYHSSSVDFCEEYGFDNEGEAHALLADGICLYRHIKYDEVL